MNRVKRGIKSVVRVFVPKFFNVLVIFGLIFQPIGPAGLQSIALAIESEESAAPAAEESAPAPEPAKEEEKTAPAAEKESAPAPKEETAPAKEETVTVPAEEAPTAEESTPDETSAEESADTPTDTPAETPIEELADTPAEIPTDTPIDTPATTPETPASGEETPVSDTEETAETSQETVAETTPAVSETEESASEEEETVCLSASVNESSEKNVWEVDGEKAKTKDAVELGVRYVFPLDEEVSITFTCLPKDEGKRAPLSIERIKASDIDLPDGVAAVTEYAYDITTEGMKNGDFKYDLSLPKMEADKAEVKYIEQDADEVVADQVTEQELKSVDEKKVEEKTDSVTVTELDHFTIFIVTSSGNVPTLATGLLNNQTQVTVAPNAAITVTLKVTTSGSGNTDNWFSSQYKIGSDSWVCVNTDNNENDGTYTESFDINAPATTGTYNLSLKVYNGDSCTGGSSSEYVMTDAITVTPPYQVTPNPSLPQACGLDIALVIDNSDSINSTELGQMKSALNGFVSALSGTPTQFSVTKFGSSASVVQNFPGATATTAINSIGTGGGATNWKDAFIKARSTFDPRASKPNLIIFATDGNPTYPYGAGNVTDSGDINDAVTEANTTKSSNGGVRVLALGIGDGLSVDNLKAISGSNVNTGNLLTSDVVTTNFSGLATELADFASETCGGTITVTKHIDGVQAPNALLAGWEFSIDGDTYLTDTTGKTAAVGVDPGSYSVTETNTPRNGYAYSSASCSTQDSTVKTTNIQNGVSGVSVGANDIVSCTFNNVPTQVCGNGVTENNEQCDAGNQNGVTCTPAYGGSCTYCTGQCTPVTINGPYCGDNIKNGTEECDGTAGVPNASFTCDKSCKLELVEPKVTICHATDSHSNPYNVQQPNKSADVSGHDGHNGSIWYPGIADHSWGDIIPPFDYIGGSYPGKNWDAAGEAIWRNQCSVPKGTIIIEKQTFPDKYQQNFVFDPSWSTDTFSLSDGGQHSVSLDPGTYSVVETVPTGWDQTSATCSDQSPIDAISLQAGETVTCVFTNTLKKTDIAIDKTDSPDPVTSGGLLTYTITVNNGSSVDADNVVVTDNLPGAVSSLTSVTPSQGTCSDSTLPSPITCALGTIAAGGSATVIIKAIVVGLGSIENTASVVTSTHETNLENNTTGEKTDIVDLPSRCDAKGTRWATSIYGATQGVRKDGSPVLPERSIPASALGAPNATTGPDSGFYSLGKGGSLTVAFATPVVNGLGTDISIHEITNGRDSYPEEKATIEVYDSTWHTVGTASSLAAGGVTYLDIAPYTNVTRVRITDTTNFALNGASNADGFDVDAIDADCRSTITVKKNLDTDGDGDVDQYNVNTWTWDIDGSGNYQTGSSQEVSAGTYVISEDNQPTYHFGSLICDNVPENSPTPEIEVGEGDTMVCTYTNTRDTGTITIVKDAVNNDYQDFSFTTTGGLGSFTLDDDGNNSTHHGGRSNTQIFTGKTSGVYTVTEGLVNGWKLTNISCSDGSQMDLTTRTATITLDAGENVICTFTNTELGKIEGFKWNDVDGDSVWDHDENKLNDWKIFIDQNGNSTYDDGEPTTATDGHFWFFGWHDAGAYAFANLLPGTYSVCEVPQEGWYNSTPICQTTELTPGDEDDVNFANHRTTKVKVTKIVCTDEKDLPNWGASGGPNITASTAQNWVHSHKSCSFATDWKFQWSYDGVGNPGDNNTGDPLANWTTFGPTNGSGVAETNISDLGDDGKIWVREAFQSGYLPFTYGVSGNANNVSAEMYCHTDVINYDNWEWINNPRYDETYYCVAWNVKLGSIHGQKWEDRDGNGQWSEGEGALAGWTIFLDKDGDKALDEGEQSMVTSGDELHFGWYWFDNLLPGTYSVCEVGQTGWQQTSPSDAMCHSVTIPEEEGEMVENSVIAPVHNFGNIRLGKITGTKYEDCNGNGEQDNDVEEMIRATLIDEGQNEDEEEEVCQETGLAGWTIYLDLNNNGEWDDNEPTDVTDENGEYSFDVVPGHYVVRELIKKGWQQTGNICDADPNDDENEGDYDQNQNARTTQLDGVEVVPGQTAQCPIGNMRTPSLSIEKWNDSASVEHPGNTVRYHIRVTAHYNDVLDVRVTDLPPEGFGYVSGSAVADQGSLSHTYASPGVWSLGNMTAGQSVELAYNTAISGTQDSGDYKDLAYASGTSEAADPVIADDLIESDNFVGTNVEVAVVETPVVTVREDNEHKIVEKTKKKTVLGASTLPLTGANTNYLTLALVLLLGGIGLYVFGKRRRNDISSSSTTETTLKTLLFVLGVGMLALSSQTASAASLGVQIETPKAVVDSPDFKIGFVTLDILDRDITVKCWKSGDVSPFQTSALSSGGNSGNCQLSAAVMPVDGDYSFYVTAETTSGVSESATSGTVPVKLVTGPGTPYNYDRHDASCMNTITFTTATDSGNTMKVELYRSLSTSFSADDSTKVSQLAIGSAADGSFSVPAPGCSNDYFYAIRAVDIYGFASAFVGDVDRTVDEDTVTHTQTTVVGGTTVTTGAIPVATEGAAAEGQVQGAETVNEEGTTAEGQGAVLGEATETGEDTGFASKHPWLTALFVLIALALAYYAYVRKQRNAGQ